MSSEVYLIADDGLAYKNPRYEGMVDNDLVEFFVCFSANEPPEVVIEKIPNYRPHRGADSRVIWAWYGRAALTILKALGFEASSVRKALACTRKFSGGEERDRPTKAMSFFFDLVAPIPAKQITGHDGCAEFTGEHPEGVFQFNRHSPTEDETPIHQMTSRETQEGSEETKEPYTPSGALDDALGQHFVRDPGGTEEE